MGFRTVLVLESGGVWCVVVGWRHGVVFWRSVGCGWGVSVGGVEFWRCVFSGVGT